MSKRKLLLADDSITIQKVVNLTFADEGIEVISVGDGDSAMRKFDEFMPDLVMADVNMPGLNGYEVCRIIKRTEETQNIPVILLVGSFEPFDEGEAKDAGADDYLTKPFQSIRQLVNKVTDLLNQRERAPEAPPDETPTGETLTDDKFAATLEFEKQPDASAEYQEIGSEFGDAGMDDEMIETSPANEYVAADDLKDAEDPEYGKTQPLNADDLKGFEIVPGGNAEPETTGEPPAAAALSETAPERAEAASFDEEARKLGVGYEDGEPSANREAIPETEPELDYYLPVGDEAPVTEFDAQVSDAETLEPDVSYLPEEPREANFSQAVEEPAVEETDAAQPFEESVEPAAAFSTNESEYSGYRETGTGGESEPSASAREFYETAPAAPTGYEEAEPAAAAAEYAEAEEDADTAEYPAGDLMTEPETEAAPADETGAVQEAPSSAPVNVPALNFEDGDLLELPPLVEETGIRPQPKAEPVAEPEPVAETSAEPEAAAAEPEAETPAESVTLSGFPPELIEAIAQKVAEKISAKTLNDVLPQITELVMKKMAEENQKEEK